MLRCAFVTVRLALWLPIPLDRMRLSTLARVPLPGGRRHHHRPAEPFDPVKGSCPRRVLAVPCRSLLHGPVPLIALSIPIHRSIEIANAIDGIVSAASKWLSSSKAMLHSVSVAVSAWHRALRQAYSISIGL